jgi:hypothetical protein
LQRRCVSKSTPRPWFHQYVIDYDQTSQRELLRTLKDLGNSRQEHGGNTAAWVEALRARARPLAIAVAVAVFAWFASRRLRRRDATAGLPPWYRTFARRVGDVGHVRQPGETFAVFHVRLKAAGFDAATLDPVTAALEQELYAGRPASPVAATALRASMARLEVPRRGARWV